jgi:hypothetical protein
MPANKILICLYFLCMPFSCFAENKAFLDVRDGREVNFILTNETIGYYPKSDSVVRSIRTIGDGTVVYNAVYSIDAFSRRITPVKHTAARENFMLCFGCSLMFGEGVNDTETLPYYLARFMPVYRPYNYAYAGYGPQEMLAKLQSGAIGREINEKHGIALFLFIDNHVNRTIGSLRVAGNWGGDMPYYSIGKNNALVRNGSFISGRHFTTALYQKVINNKFLNRWIQRKGRDFPTITNGHVTLACRVIEESRNEFRRQFNSDDFYVIIFPGSTHADLMMRYFRTKGIKYLDYHTVTEFNKEKYSILNDGHPTAIAYKTLAEMVAKDIKSGQEIP